MFHANVNVNLMEKNVIRIKSGITNVDVSVNIGQSILCVKKIIFGILHPGTCSFEKGKYLTNI